MAPWRRGRAGTRPQSSPSRPAGAGAAAGQGREGRYHAEAGDVDLRAAVAAAAAAVDGHVGLGPAAREDAGPGRGLAAELERLPEVVPGEVRQRRRGVHAALPAEADPGVRAADEEEAGDVGVQGREAAQLHLEFGRIVGSKIEPPNLLVNLV
jgi:hypothetical protein